MKAGLEVEASLPMKFIFQLGNLSHKFCLLRLRRCDIWPFSEENSVFMTLMLFDNDDRTPEIILNVFQTFLFYGDHCAC